MPIYEYKCEACGYQFEQLQKIDAAPLKTCPECHARKLKKLVSNTSFQLKGSGWYVTDFKDKKPKAADNPATKTEVKKAATSKTEVKQKTEEKK